MGVGLGAVHTNTPSLCGCEGGSAGHQVDTQCSLQPAARWDGKRGRHHEKRMHRMVFDPITWLKTAQAGDFYSPTVRKVSHIGSSQTLFSRVTQKASQFKILKSKTQRFIT